MKNPIVPPNMPNRALIVDDDIQIRELYRDIAEDANYFVYEAECGETFTNALKASIPTIIFLDLTMPRTDGIELLRDLARISYSGPVILVSGQDERVIGTSKRLGKMLGLNMYAALTKPVTVDAIYKILNEFREDNMVVTTIDIQSGIKNREFELLFQPKVSLEPNMGYRVKGGEALIRWNHPRLGHISPDDFIPLAETAGIIGDITNMVLENAIDHMESFANAGVLIPISVNISPSDLTDLSLPDRIASLLKSKNIPPDRLVLEITEQAAMSDIYSATEILTRLRIKGISVSLDDFGSGFSSMVEIYRMPLSELKIDRSLVADLEADPGAQTVMKAIAALARELNIPLCVEGIETEATAKFLEAIGCQTAQGFYFSRPLTPELFHQFALKHAANDVGVSRVQTRSS